MDFESRQTWRNFTGNQSVFPLRIYRPTSIEDVVAIVQEAEKDRVTTRAVGSHHSWSDAAITTGYLIETHGLNRFAATPALLKPGIDSTPLVEVQAGIRLAELNAELDRLGRALVQMGGYDGQTLGGVLGTSTHGSGIGFGPIADQVRSLDLVASGGRCFRIERTLGITDRAAFLAHHHGWELWQDDEAFDAARVGIGCLGIVCSVILETRDKFWLNEVRWLEPWSRTKAELQNGVLQRHEHYEVYLNPHPTLPCNDYQCLITTRTPIPKPGNLPDDRRHRNWLVEVGGGSRFLAFVIRTLYVHWPQLTPRIIDRGLRQLEDKGYANVSYKVYNIGSANHMPAISSEIGIEVDPDGNFLNAVQAVMDVAAQWRAEGKIYHSSPISLRFVKGTTASLSMMEGRNTMMMELILFYPTDGGMELLAAYEDALAPLGGRPHWGQVNYVSATEAELIRMYPRYPSWKGVHDRLNASGVFNSPFTKRVGITPTGVIP